jgi:hypothetical protein
VKDWFVLPPNNVINNCLAGYLDSNIADGSRAGEFFNTIGHQDAFRPPSLNGGCRLGKATFAGIGGKEEDAPIPAVRLTTPSRLKSTHSGPSKLTHLSKRVAEEVPHR